METQWLLDRVERRSRTKEEPHDDRVGIVMFEANDGEP